MAILEHNFSDVFAQKHGEKPRVLVLQGPVGPIFSELHETLNNLGWNVKRVIFNSGDSLFAKRNECIRFSGTLDEWRSWINAEIVAKTPEAITLFGSSRPVDKVVRDLAAVNKITVISLEVEYMRELLRDLIEDYDHARDTRSEAARRLLRLDLFEGWVLSGRRRLSARYLREAQGRRRRALRDFMAA